MQWNGQRMCVCACSIKAERNECAYQKESESKHSGENQFKWVQRAVLLCGSRIQNILVGEQLKWSEHWVCQLSHDWGSEWVLSMPATAWLRQRVSAKYDSHCMTGTENGCVHKWQEQQSDILACWKRLVIYTRTNQVSNRDKLWLRRE